MNDEELLSVLKRGLHEDRENAIRLIYRENFPKALSFIKRNSGSDEYAKDIFQDAMLLFYKKIKNDEFKGNASPHTFLFGIVKNLWMQSLDKQKRYQNIKKDLDHEVYENPVEPIDKLFSNESIVGHLMSKMNEGCKELLTAYYYQNTSIEKIKIEKELGSEQAVRTKIYRCMQKLRAICTENKITRHLLNH